MHSYITHISRAPANHTQTILPCPDNRHAIPTAAYIPWEPLCIVSLASLEVTDEMRDGIRIYTTKLTFQTHQPLPPDTTPFAYHLTLTDHTHLLLGTAQRPHPLRTTTDTREDRPTGKSTITHTITWTSPHPPFIII